MSGCPVHPPKPRSRPEKISLWQHLKLFRRDIFSSQPQRLYRAWMAEFRTPFFRSYFVNQPELVDLVLKTRPDDFPKSNVIARSLKSLLGVSVFVTNGAEWKRQRRIIDPAFEKGRLRETYPAMLAAVEASITRLKSGPQTVEIEAETSHLAADIIFRTLFSIPITDGAATRVFEEFRRYQRSQPLLNLSNFLPLPRRENRQTRESAAEIRKLLASLTAKRQQQIDENAAPDDLATKIMTTADPETGQLFNAREMVDQVAIFFLAGHETSASALAWALYLLALDPSVQGRVLAEVQENIGTKPPDFADIARLSFTRDVFREALRLYPPVPMMVRSNKKREEFRARAIRPGSQIVLSPWHLQRHERLWDNADAFDPDRWQTEAGKASARVAYMPFSAGPRVCTGAGFAMIEGVLALALLVRAFRIEPSGEDPVPVAHLTVRAENGIRLSLCPREGVE